MTRDGGANLRNACRVEWVCEKLNDKESGRLSVLLIEGPGTSWNDGTEVLSSSFEKGFCSRSSQAHDKVVPMRSS
jgi:hypothetical protein